MIRPGDRVKFVNDTTVGTVASIQGKIAHVAVEEGFELPVMLTDLVAIDAEAEQKAIRRMGVGDGVPVGTKGPKPKERKARPQRPGPQYGKISLVDDAADDDDDEDLLDLTLIRQNYLKRNSEANAAALQREEAVRKAAPSPVELTNYDIKLCFVPQDAASPEDSAQLACYLVNDSSYRLFYTIGRWSNGNYLTLIASGEMEEDSKKIVKTFRREELNRLGRWQFGLMLFKPTNFVPAPVEDFTLEFSPLKFVRRGSYVENDFFDEPAVVFTLSTDKEEFKQRQAAEKALAENLKENLPKIASKPAVKPKLSDEPEIVDLHVEEILDSTEGMSAGEIVRAQLARFEIALDLAVGAGRRQRIVFIHGVGSGKLKHEMEKLLAAKYPRVRHQDASFKEYGYGAMMVFF